MITKRYSFPTEHKAKELILQLADKDNELPFTQIRGTEKTHGIVCLGFQDKYKFNEETKENELIEKGTTYNVDIAWKELDESFEEFEVNPKTPNHKFA